MGGLAIGRVPYERGLRFVWPLLVVLTLTFGVHSEAGQLRR
jgi:uncharacterized ion transporter superfamily protein YfcC